MADVDLGTRHLHLSHEDHLAWCTIDRPERRNALTIAMYFGIRKAVHYVNTRPEPTALILTGSGDVFAPGGEMAGHQGDGNPAEAETLGQIGNEWLPFEAVRNSRAPVVSAINGLCQGGGLLIAMLSDVSLASDRARFRAPELLRGIADMGYAAYLPAHVGLARARDLLLTARELDADEAVAMGLVSRRVPHDGLREAAVRAAEAVLRTAPDARLHVKRALNAGYGKVDLMTFNASLDGPESAEGMTSFKEKRTPTWVPKTLARGGRL